MNIVCWKINYARCCWILKNYDKIKSYIFAEYAFDFALKNNRELVTAIHKSIFLKLGYGLVKTTLVLWIMLLYQLFPIHDNSLFWPYGSILSNFGAALIDVLSLVPGASFGRCCSGFDQIAVTLLWILKLRTQNWLNGNSHFMVQCILLLVTTDEYWNALYKKIWISWF